MKKNLFFYASMLAMPFVSDAQTDSTETTWKDKLPFEISGSVDAYVQTNFTPKVTNDVGYEAFSYNANSFNLGMANLMLSKDFGKVGFMADLAFGPRAFAANGDGFAGVIKQLYLTYKPAEFVELTMGTFSTFFGYEVIEPTGNFQYSTSLAFQNGPFYHTGLKANFTKDKINFMVAVMNPTDTKEVLTRKKFVGSQLGYSADNGGIYLNYVGGSFLDEEDQTMKSSFRHSLDVTGTINVGKEKGGLLGLNAALHYQNDKTAADEVIKSKYYTTYLYAQGPVADFLSVGGRLGYFGDPDGLAGIGSKSFFDATVNANIYVGPLTFIPEVRVKYANEELFFKNDGSGSKIQPTMLLAAVISF